MGDFLVHFDSDHDGTLSVGELRVFMRFYIPEQRKVARKSALIIIDVQNDFISGTLANPSNAQDIVPIINGLRDQFDVVVISYDWHPQDHCSFVESVNEGKFPIIEELQQFNPFTMVTLKGDADRPEHQQVLYPRHAVQNSDGGKTHVDLVVKDTDRKVYKGVRANIDSYSAFFDNMKANDTGLTDMLVKEQITDVYCCGLVFDICVKSSALHGAEMGFKTYVIEDACKPFFVENVQETKTQLEKAGVTVISSADVSRPIAKEFALQEFLREISKQNDAVEVHQKEVKHCSH